MVEFFAYISFFPQLVAGPIERATNLLPQFQKQRQFEYAKAVDGLRQILWGFFKKMVIADNCAVVVNHIWAVYTEETGFVLLVGAILFAFQIYCDFSGYSDIAIGCARLFGFNLMRNFNFPYFSRSIPEFWRCWHISLTSWFRDYIYFPLGGNRCDKWRTSRNVFIVWCLSGLWHGANWTFVCWGLFHAILLSVYNVFGINTKYKNNVAYRQNLPSIKELSQIILTFLITVIGWIIFRARSINDAEHYIMGMCNSSLFDIMEGIDNLKGLPLTVDIAAITIMIVAEWIHRDKQHALQFSNDSIFAKNVILRYIVYFLLVMITLIFAGTQSKFLYFQF